MTAPLPFPSAGPAPVRQGLLVFVKGLRVEAGIGVHDHELGRLQPLDLEVTLDLGAGPVERLADTVDYGRVAEAARAIAAEGHVGLVENFAERLALACLADPRVRGVMVRVEKPGALGDGTAPGCEVRYGR